MTASTDVLKLHMLALLLAQLISCGSAQVPKCSSSDTRPICKLCYQTKFSINGCPVFVYGKVENYRLPEGLVAEPLMCVTQSLRNLLPKYDPVTEQTYVSVPVMLRDDAMLKHISQQMRQSMVKFFNVSEIKVSAENSSGLLQALDFIWTPEEPVGYLKLGCLGLSSNCSIENLLRLTTRLSDSSHILNRVVLTANIVMNSTEIKLNYRLVLQNSSFLDPDRFKLNCTSDSNIISFSRSISVSNCTARVHERQDTKGHFLIEPLLCHNTTSFSKESILQDYSRDMYYLQLDLVLYDDRIFKAVQKTLAQLSSRRNVFLQFMHLWNAEIVVSSALSRFYEIGPLMMSEDWASGQMRVYCRSSDQCRALRQAIFEEPLNFWKHIGFNVTSAIPNRFIVKSKDLVYVMQPNNTYEYLKAAQIRNVSTKSVDGMNFVLIQQRLTGSVSFQRSWREYEIGFGDENDFWIGLSTIHSLSINGVPLRVEMKLSNGTELYAEFSRFKVEDASTNYTMTYESFISDRSTASFPTPRGPIGRRQFSTMDRDNRDALVFKSSCSREYGKYGGWWYTRSCDFSHPNGIYDDDGSSSAMSWESEKDGPFIREIRLMLYIS